MESILKANVAADQRREWCRLARGNDRPLHTLVRGCEATRKREAYLATGSVVNLLA